MGGSEEGRLFRGNRAQINITYSNKIQRIELIYINSQMCWASFRQEYN